MAKRIVDLLKRNGIESDVDTVETIISGNGTKADGDVYDIIETIVNYCEITDETADIINELALI